MTKRVFWSTFLVAIAVLAASLVLIVGVLYTYFAAQHVQELENEAVYIAQAVENEGESYLDSLDSISTRITWIDQDGTVLYDNFADPSEMENHSDRQEFIQAQQTGEGKSARYSNTLSERTTNFALLLDDSTVLRVSGSQLSVWALVVSILQPILVVLAVAIVLSALLAYRTSRRVVQPLGKVDLEHPMESSDQVYDELAPFLTRIERQNRQINSQITALQEKQNELETITSHMNEGLLILGHNGNVLSMNRRAKEIFGVTDEYIGRNMLMLNRSSKLTRALQNSLAGESARTELNLNQRQFQVLTSPVQTEDGQDGCVVLALDVTESYQAEQMRREFSANVSHELKTPLTSISGYAELMSNGMVEQKNMVQFSKRIYQEATRLIHLVEDIIRISRLDEGDDGIRKEQVELAGMTEKICARLSQVAEQAHISMAVDCQPCTVLGVPRVLEEMIENLVDNAIKYNRPEGSVSVKVCQQGTNALIEVADTGVGIPAEHQSRVFERFYRVDKSHSKETGGTGLGLSIVKHSVILHKGKISLKSKEGVGSTFTILLPIQQEEQD